MRSSTLVPLTPGAGEATEILGVKLNGPVDSAGYLVPIVGGLPQHPITTLIEVKNIRRWVYPKSQELYQVLDKAAQVCSVDVDDHARDERPAASETVCWEAAAAPSQGRVGEGRQGLIPVGGRS